MQVKVSFANQNHTFNLQKQDSQFQANFNELQTIKTDTSEILTYNGDYIVTPAFEEQTLETEGKKMQDDVMIKSIPYYETSNSTGITIFIGAEVG